MINKIWDKIGICASGLCLIHCLITPMLLLIIPSFTFTEGSDDLIHKFFAVVVVTSILFAVYPTCRKHGHKDIIVFALVGILLILVSTFMPSLPEPAKHIMTIIASINLITAHIKNIRLRHSRCETNHHNH